MVDWKFLIRQFWLNIATNVCPFTPSHIEYGHIAL